LEYVSQKIIHKVKASCHFSTHSEERVVGGWRVTKRNT
jgi:hypothetical protein